MGERHKKPCVWIHTAIHFPSGDIHTVARMAKAFRASGADVFILTDEASKKLMLDSSEGFFKGDFIIMPQAILPSKPSLTVPPEILRKRTAERLKAAKKAFDNPLKKPDAVITERPLNAFHSAFLPDFADYARKNGAMFISRVRDITGIFPEDIWPELTDRSDLVLISGGGPQLSDFDAYKNYFARTGQLETQFDNDRVRYVGSFVPEAALKHGLLSDSKTPSDSQPILVHVGSALNDRYVDEKMAILEGAIKAWSGNPDLQRHPLRLLVPKDASREQLSKLEQLMDCSPDPMRITLGAPEVASAFYARCARCSLLVTTGGTTTVEAAQFGTPMLIMPLNQTSKEQEIRANKMAEIGILRPFGRRKNQWPIFVPVNLIKNKSSTESFGTCMENACGQSHQIIQNIAADHIKPGGAERIAEITLEAIEQKRVANRDKKMLRLYRETRHLPDAGIIAR